MEKIKLTEGLKFVNDSEPSDSFIVKKWHYYCDNKEVWCAFTADNFILPLDAVELENYLPVVEGKIINEKYELEF